jgi:hypothetical protein
MATLVAVARLAVLSALVLLYIASSSFAFHHAGGGIDITNGAMIVTTSSFGFVPSGGFANEYGSAGVAEYGDPAIHDAIIEGFNYPNGYWDGSNGIYSSTAANDPDGNKAVGWIDNDALGQLYSNFRGVPVPPGSSIIAYTYQGDTDLDGRVNISDALNLGNAYGFPPPRGGYMAGNGLPSGAVDWIDGDTDYSGDVFIADALNLGNAYALPDLYTPAPTVPTAEAATAIPEPATLALAIAGAFCGLVGRLRSTRRLQFPLP